jgi:hypothetical protein
VLTGEVAERRRLRRKGFPEPLEEDLERASEPRDVDFIGHGQTLMGVFQLSIWEAEPEPLAGQHCWTLDLESYS